MKTEIKRSIILSCCIIAFVFTGCVGLGRIAAYYKVPNTDYKLWEAKVYKEGTKKIGNRDCYYKELWMVSIPHGVTEIGKQAFAKNKLFRVHIPESCTKIAPDAFDKRVTLVYMKDMPGEYVGNYKIHPNETGITITNFIGKEKNVVIPAQIDGKTVTQIGSNAFAGKALLSVVIPDTVTVIDNGAFEYNFIRNVDIPQGVTKIANVAFYNNVVLSTVKLPNTLLEINDGSFWGCVRLKNITIPDSVVTLHKEAFSADTLLKGNRKFIQASLVLQGGAEYFSAPGTSVQLLRIDDYNINRFNTTVYLLPGKHTVWFEIMIVNDDGYHARQEFRTDVISCEIDFQPGEKYIIATNLSANLLSYKRVETTITGPKGIVFSKTHESNW